MLWTFGRLTDRALTRLHSSTANTSLTTEVKFWLNIGYQDLHSRPNKIAPWATRRTTLLSTAPTTSSTISLVFTLDDATVTSSGGSPFTSAMVGRKIKLGSFSEVYTIRTFTSTSSIELDQPFNGATSTSTGWRIWEDTILLPPFTHEVISVQIRGRTKPLEKTDPQDWLDEYGDNPGEGTPVKYTNAPSDSQEEATTTLTGNWTFTDESRTLSGSNSPAALTELKVGDLVRKNSTDILWREVASIESDSSVTLRQAWNGSTGAGGISLAQKAGGWRRLIFGPHFDDEYSLIVNYQKIPTELAADANIPEMPESIAHILIEGALALGGFEFRDDQRKEQQMQKWENEVAKVLVDVRKTSQRPRFLPDLRELHQAFPMS